LILIDTSSPPPCPYVPFLISHLPTKGHITDIILTHYHHDHVGGLPLLLESLKARRQTHESPPRIWKLLCESEWGKKQDDKILKSISHLSPDEHYVPYRLSPLEVFHPLSPGTSFEPCHELEVIHTPGHTEDSTSFLWKEGEGKVWLWTADTVLGQGTTVFMNLSDYMKSLDLLKRRVEREDGEKVKILPGRNLVSSHDQKRTDQS
jgi:endoribonuclease LACTB2